MTIHRFSSNYLLLTKISLHFKQVWEVRLSKRDPSNSEIQTLIASSRVTLLCNMSVPESARDAAKKLKKYAKL